MPLDENDFWVLFGLVTGVGAFWIMRSNRTKEVSSFRNDAFSKPTAQKSEMASASSASIQYLPTYVLSGAKPHEVLGVDPDASREQIQIAYKRLIRMCHPDRMVGDVDKKAAEISASRINWARDEMLKRDQKGSP